MGKILENEELLNFNISRKKFILRCNIIDHKHCNNCTQFKDPKICFIYHNYKF